MNMKKSLVLVALAAVLMSAGKAGDEVITKEDGMYVVNTTTIAKDVEGYNGAVPIKIYIKKNKIQKIEVLKNQEGPKYLNMVKKTLLNAWDGLTLKEAKAKQVDAVTGATFTSKALIENVNRGIDYYQKNK
ncbi:MAG: FMN-binding protein [Prevotella sp.]|nr:FMN-binding protein [Prevotella sp.]